MSAAAEVTEVAEHVPVAVVGGGQAGLSASWFLARAGVAHVVLERETAGHDWQDRRWDSFTLVTPNVQCRLPGFPYPGDDPYGFMTREQTVAYLAEYVRRTAPPLRERTAVRELRQDGEGGFVLELDTPDGARTLHAEQVVVATGGYHVPRVPLLAERLPADLVQVHSAAYKRPDALPDGAVLVVGTGQSGAQIAEDLHLAGRQVHLVVGSAPRCARRYRGRDCIDWLEEMGLYDVAVEDTPGGLREREKTNHYMTGRDGGHEIDLRRFALEGMSLYGRLVDVVGTRLAFAPTLEASLDRADKVAEDIKDAIDRHVAATGADAPAEPRYVPVWRPSAEPAGLDLAAAGITSVVWATGFASDFRWVHVPVFDGRGAVGHHRGVTGVDGLHFLGLPWLHTWGSGRFAGLTRDAEHVVDHVLARGMDGLRPQRHLRLTS